jgi:hypothetical protein
MSGVPLQPQKLGTLHVVNCVAFAAQSLLTYANACRSFGMSHLDVAWVYPTLVTPADFAFGIWLAVFGLQAYFAVMQLQPDYRSSPLLVKGIGYHYAAACVCQAVWSTCTIPNEMMVSSLVLTAAIVVIFFALVRSLSRYPTQRISEFLIFKAPFYLHGAWICFVAVLNLNMIVVQTSPTNSRLQRSVAALSLVILPLAAIAASLAGDGWLAAVVCWTFYGIAWNLASPPPLLEQRFAPVVFELLIGAARAFATVSGGVSAVLAFRAFRATRVTLMMAPQREFEPEGLVVLPLRPIPWEVERTESRDNPSCAPQWFAELQPHQHTATKREELA